MNSATDLMKEMIMVFDQDVTGREAATRLTHIRQGNQSVAAFSITFRSLAGETGWPEAPLCTLFSNALIDPVKDALALMDYPDTLDALISAAIRVDKRIREREWEKQGTKTTRTTHIPHSQAVLVVGNPPYSSIGEEPMQVDSSHLRQGREFLPLVICWHCRQKGHLRRNCPKRKGNE